MKSTTKSEEPADNSEAFGRAAAADQAEQIDFISESDPEPDPEPQFTIDPGKIHALMVVAVKGLTLRLDHFVGWEKHPADDWYEATTQITEVLIEKWLGKGSAGPELAMLLQIGNHAADNMLDDLFKSAESKESPKPTEQSLHAV